jgi:hypothetical protein
MLTYLRDAGQLSDRKARLFGLACCRRVWHLLVEERFRRAVEVAERYSDGKATAEELSAAHEATRGGEPGGRHRGGGNAREFASYAVRFATTPGEPFKELDVGWCDLYGAESASLAAALHLASEGPHPEAARRAFARRERANQCALLRDLFGLLPFRTPSLAPSLLVWNDRAIPRLADRIYIGCDDQPLLEHLAVPEGHWRGCWVLDVLTSRG